MMAREERLYELLATKATEGLSSRDANRLDDLLLEFPAVDPQELDHAAAVVHLALLGPERPMPAALKQRLAATAERHAETLSNHRTQSDPPLSTPSRRWSWWAAAAALALAVIGWWPRLQPVPQVVRDIAPEKASVSDRLLADPTTLRLTWTPTEDATAGEASGEVVWNTDQQIGFMRFSGLEVNDPAVFQYQLWIFDRSRDERYPVDGGVFDIQAGANEIVVPIDPRVPVGEPYLFAVTVEPPGGVVVSTRERIALLAQA